MTPSLEIEPEPQWWEVSALTTTTTLLLVSWFGEIPTSTYKQHNNLSVNEEKIWGAWQ